MPHWPLLHRLVTKAISIITASMLTMLDTGGMSFNRPAATHQQGSLDSTTSSSGTNAHSQRSSFAMERASIDANRSSLEMFASLPPQQAVPVETGHQNLEAMCCQMGIPKAMCDR